MEIIQENYDKSGVFMAIEDNQEAGRMTYTWVGPSRFSIDHTTVEPAFEGRGVGRSLVMAAVEWAREENLKIIPICPYAQSVFRKTPEIADVLA